jgi:hypothetical protein
MGNKQSKAVKAILKQPKATRQLWEAVERGDVFQVRHFLEKGGNPNAIGGLVCLSLFFLFEFWCKNLSETFINSITLSSLALFLICSLSLVLFRRVLFFPFHFSLFPLSQNLWTALMVAAHKDYKTIAGLFVSANSFSSSSSSVVCFPSFLRTANQSRGQN